jgi:tripartite-type tricarboxylate transporter receptor subunit TctC
MTAASPCVLRRLWLALPLLLAPWAGAFAQAYPDKSITLIVPFPPGAVTDRVGRALGAELGKRLGQAVIVENVGGASGTLAGKKLLRAPADGYTLLMGTVNDMVVAPIALKADYSVKDFTPIAKVSLTKTVFVAHPSFPANTADELVAYARKSQDRIPLGVTGVAMIQTLGATMFAKGAGIKFSLVPYKGGGPLLTDLLAGQIQVATISLASALPHIRGGKLKALGVISLQRDPTASDIPTVNEGKAVKGVEADIWLGLAAPRHLPAPIAARLSAAMRDILADRAFKESEFRAGDLLADYAEQAVFREFLVQEEERLRGLASAAKGD